MARFTFIMHICNQNDKFFLTVPFANQVHEKKKNQFGVPMYTPVWLDHYSKCTAHIHVDTTFSDDQSSAPIKSYFGVPTSNVLFFLISS